MDRISWFRGITCCSYCRRKQTYSNLHNRAHRLLRDITGYVGAAGAFVFQDISGCFNDFDQSSGLQAAQAPGAYGRSGFYFDASCVVPTANENRPLATTVPLLISF